MGTGYHLQPDVLRASDLNTLEWTRKIKFMLDDELSGAVLPRHLQDTVGREKARAEMYKVCSPISPPPTPCMQARTLARTHTHARAPSLALPLLPSLSHSLTLSLAHSHTPSLSVPLALIPPPLPPSVYLGLQVATGLSTRAAQPEIPASARQWSRPDDCLHRRRCASAWPPSVGRICWAQTRGRHRDDDIHTELVRHMPQASRLTILRSTAPKTAGSSPNTLRQAPTCIIFA